MRERGLRGKKDVEGKIAAYPRRGGNDHFSEGVVKICRYESEIKI